MRKILFVVLVLLSRFTFGQDFEVSPLQLFFNAEPGESQSKYIKIINHKSTTETFVLKLKDISIDSKGAQKYEDAGSMKNSLADFITMSPSFFELNPNEVQEVAVTIQQPVDEFGSRWGVIQIGTAIEQTSFSADKGISAGMSISGRIIVDVFQTPGTNKSYKATITNLTEVTTETDSVRTFSMLINNLSDIITNCDVYLVATDIRTAEEFYLPKNKFTLYPKSTQKTSLKLITPLPKGKYSLAAILDYGSKTNLEGTQIIIEVK